MSNQFEDSIVRIFKKDQFCPVGVGLRVSHRHIVTCAHVVADALDTSRYTPEMPTGKVYLDFPLAAPKNLLIAKTICWCPVQIDTSIISNHEEDIAVLELETGIPSNTKFTPPVIGDDLWEHSFRAFGFPIGHEDGIWAYGKLQGKRANGWMQ